MQTYGQLVLIILSYLSRSGQGSKADIHLILEVTARPLVPSVVGPFGPCKQRKPLSFPEPIVSYLAAPTAPVCGKSGP